MKGVNKIIKVFIISDFFLNYAWGLLGPIFAIFILENITKGSVEQAITVAGFSSLAYWIVKSIFQIPIGRFLDRNHGEKDDFWFIIYGTLITALAPIGYLFSTEPWHIYLWQSLHAVGMAIALPPWMAIFTRHIDKGKEAFEWGTESTFFGMGAGIGGAVGGLIAAIAGFQILFLMVSGFTIFSTILLFVVRKEILVSTVRTPEVYIAKSVVEP